LHFHSTDGDGEWLARLGAEGLVVTREHAKGDVAVRGVASDLLLFLYGRVGTERLEVFGDAALLARWRELVTW
jgi:predicted lipid carrier protein YhbT